MERIMKFISKLLEKYKRFRGWLQKNPRNIVIAVVCFVAVIAVSILVTRFFSYIFTAVLVLWAFSDEIKAFFKRFFNKRKLPNLEDDGVCFETTKFMHRVICEDKPLDEIVRTPPTVHSIYDNNDYRELYNDVTMLKLRLIRKNRDKDPDCDYLKIVLQDSVIARLADGYLRGYLWAVPTDSTVPLIKVTTFDYSDLYVYIGILLTNNLDCVNAARISDMPVLTEAADDADPLFTEDEGEE